jgi:hypothetical protein
LAGRSIESALKYELSMMISPIDPYRRRALCKAYEHIHSYCSFTRLVSSSYIVKHAMSAMPVMSYMSQSLM